ncbi:MAG: DUF3467 domain-containing protein [Bacteroidales bacterium]|nr:DUF3467 domain-containing protein [Bacteroidales bacterium]
MENENNNKPPMLNFELTPEIAEGTYCNLAIITHSHSEFITDFIKIMPGMTKPKVQSRIILTPQHAKRLMQALIDNIAKYESVHGPIKDTNVDPMMRGPVAQA